MIPSNDGLDDDSASGESIDKHEHGEGDGDEPKWTSGVVADFDQHQSSVGRVEWNVTG